MRAGAVPAIDYLERLLCSILKDEEMARALVWRRAANATNVVIPAAGHLVGALSRAILRSRADPRWLTAHVLHLDGPDAPEGGR